MVDEADLHVDQFKVQFGLELLDGLLDAMALYEDEPEFKAMLTVKDGVGVGFNSGKGIIMGFKEELERAKVLVQNALDEQQSNG
jgi:hypothetical protein